MFRRVRLWGVPVVVVGLLLLLLPHDASPPGIVVLDRAVHVREHRHRVRPPGAVCVPFRAEVPLAVDFCVSGVMLLNSDGRVQVSDGEDDRAIAVQSLLFQRAPEGATV